MKLDELKEKIDDAGLSTIQANAASDIITRCPEGAIQVVLGDVMKLVTQVVHMVVQQAL